MTRYKLGMTAPAPAKADGGRNYSAWFWGLLGLGALAVVTTRSAKAEFRGED